MKNNDKEIREMLEKEEIPENLRPENIKTMLDEKASGRKRSKITVVSRVAAGAVACSVIVGSTVHFAGQRNVIVETSVSAPTTDTETEPTTETAKVEIVQDAPYMSGAEDYEQIYNIFEKSLPRYNSKYTDDIYGYTAGAFSDDVIEEVAADEEAVYDSAMDNGVSAPSVAPDKSFNSVEKEENRPQTGFGTADNNEIIAEPLLPSEPEEITETSTESVTEEATEPTTEEETTEPETEPTTEENEEDEDEDYSETYNQEADVLEADIVKTDGKNIYYVWNNYTLEHMYDSTYSNVPMMNIASVKKGEFTKTEKLDLTPDTSRYGDDSNCYVNIGDMYIYNDMIIVVGTVLNESSNVIDEYYSGWRTETESFVSFYTNDGNAELIGTYFQDGYYDTVRISPEGYMYLVSEYSSAEFYMVESSENIDRYIPMCGTGDDIKCLPAEDVLLPTDDIDKCTTMSYTVIGSIDLTQSGEFTPTDTKALAGYTGNLYSSADNMYTAVGWEDTDITRISVTGGNITPMASGTVEGWVKDQFSMSEYDGYFRVATTRQKTDVKGNIITDILGIEREYNYIHDNCVYVLDMDMNIVGSINDFGNNENIKSVNFSGNTAYVVTYMQTDPLFAIDLSNPYEPTIMDEFKILGYSTYMQSWGDGLLLGFGADADENGVETGVKLVMFDNSDPYDLKEVGLYSINNQEDENRYSWVSSDAMWDRKGLLIAPEKNLIGVPITIYGNATETKYMFFSYDSGEFTLKGEIGTELHDYFSDTINRAVYIGDYVYVLSGGKFVSADIETMEIKGTADFTELEAKTTLTEDTESEETTEEETEPETEEETEAETENTTETEETTEAETTEYHVITMPVEYIME